MCDRQNRESHTSLLDLIPLTRRQTDAVKARMQYEEPEEEREEDLRRSLHSLQECVCELLIQNQELRMSLLDTSNLRSGEADQ